MDPNASKKARVISLIDGSNLHVYLKNNALPTRLHYTKLSIELAKRLPKELQPWVFLRTIYVTSSPIESDNPTAFRDWQVFQDMLGRTERLELRLGRREGPPGARREKGVDTLITTALLQGALRDDYDIAILISSDGDWLRTPSMLFERQPRRSSMRSTKSRNPSIWRRRVRALWTSTSSS